MFGNAEGAYGSNVNQLIDNSRWDDEDELAETYTPPQGLCLRPQPAGRCSRPQLLQSVLAGVELAYQNLDSVELGVTTVDTYFDTLGGISRAVKRAKGAGRRRSRRSTSATRRARKARHGAHAERTGRARNPHPHAEPEMVRRHAEARLRRACARSRCT